MAVTLDQSFVRYLGLSSDAKPTASTPTGAATPPPAGARFLEQDTGRQFVFDGSRWALIAAAPEVGAAALALAELAENQIAMLRELKALRLGMISAGTCR